MQKPIIIIDYGMGNLRSVQKKIQRVGSEAEITADIDTIVQANKLILPGVGHFSNGVKKLKEKGIWNVLNKKVLVQRTPVLGICLGMQLMATRSEEGDDEGLGWFDADIIKFIVEDQLKYKVPHMGWNNAAVNKESVLFQGIAEDSMFYFVHSYHIKCNDEQDILTTTEYEYPFTSSIQKGNIFGTQFHPEKSHDSGEIVLRNFINI